MSRKLGIERQHSQRAQAAEHGNPPAEAGMIDSVGR
jgi:hypothetical protein